jgi:hypothetical protein
MLDQERISKLTRKGLTKARSAYQNTPKDKVITIELDTAIALMEKLCLMGLIHVGSHLRASTSFTPSTLYVDEYYEDAIRSANHLVHKIFAYLTTILTYSNFPLQSRTLTTGALEAEMQATMRLEIFWWIVEFCLRNSIRAGDDVATKYGRLINHFFSAHTLWHRVMSGREEEMIRKCNIAGQNFDIEGMRVLVEKMQEVVREVVGMLAWWYERKMDGQEDLGKSEGQQESGVERQDSVM